MTSEPYSHLTDPLRGLTSLGRFLYRGKIIRVYRDGDGHGFMWRWWNPLVWIAAPLAFAFVCLMQGIPEAIKYKHVAGFGMKPWFIDHPERLEWLP